MTTVKRASKTNRIMISVGGQAIFGISDSDAASIVTELTRLLDECPCPCGSGDSKLLCHSLLGYCGQDS